MNQAETNHRSLVLLATSLPILLAAIGCSRASQAPVARAGTVKMMHSPVEVLVPSASNTDAEAVSVDDRIAHACKLDQHVAYFDFDSAELRDAKSAGIAQLAKCLSEGALRGQSIKIVGHADPRGPTEYNFVLGQSRSDAVAMALADAGASSSQLLTTSRGELDAQGTDEQGWARDRRVEIRLD